VCDYFAREWIMSSLSSLTDPQCFWYQHLQQAHEQQVALTEYAQQHGLSASALYAAKGVLKGKGVLSDEMAASAIRFSAVRVIGSAPCGCTIRLPGLEIDLSSLPSAAWLVRLSQALERSA
jgi:hypothetical protein